LDESVLLKKICPWYHFGVSAPNSFNSVPCIFPCTSSVIDSIWFLNVSNIIALPTLLKRSNINLFLFNSVDSATILETMRNEIETVISDVNGKIAGHTVITGALPPKW
jgi:hypothetical protein